MASEDPLEVRRGEAGSYTSSKTSRGLRRAEVGAVAHGGVSNRSGLAALLRAEQDSLR